MIKLEVIDLDKVLATLIDLPEEIQDRAIEDINDYMLNVVRTYPSYKYVTRAHAYPNAIVTLPGSGRQKAGYFSLRQYYFVMAAIASGRMNPGTPNRSQAYSRAWRKVGTGRGQYLINTQSYGRHLQSDEQARMMQMIGWDKISDILKDRLSKIEKIIDAAVNKIMRRRGAK